MVRPPPTRPMPSKREGLKSMFTSAKVGGAAALCRVQCLLQVADRLTKLVPSLNTELQLLKLLLLPLSCRVPCGNFLRVAEVRFAEELVTRRAGRLTGWGAGKRPVGIRRPFNITTQTTVWRTTACGKGTRQRQGADEVYSSGSAAADKASTTLKLVPSVQHSEVEVRTCSTF